MNDRYPLADVLAACHRYHRARRRMVFVEYVMLAGVNDTRELAAEPAAILDPQVFKLNLIPYNPTGGEFERSDRAGIRAFKAALDRGGLRATVADAATSTAALAAACQGLGSATPSARATARAVRP